VAWNPSFPLFLMRDSSLRALRTMRQVSYIVSGSSCASKSTKGSLGECMPYSTTVVRANDPHKTGCLQRGRA
jgi:hypothetical protein